MRIIIKVHFETCIVLNSWYTKFQASQWERVGTWMYFLHYSAILCTDKKQVYIVYFPLFSFAHSNTCHYKAIDDKFIGVKCMCE